MDITNNSGVQAYPLQAPQATAHEDYRAKSSMEALQMDRAIANLLAKGAVKAVQPQDDQFISTLFLVEKDNGEFRPVINLRALNRFLGKESFKMEGDFMMKLDLKDA